VAAEHRGFHGRRPEITVAVTDQFVDELRDKAVELERLLDDFSQRLRRMRTRNREVQEEISSFEDDLDGLRQWLSEHTPD
jgi:uncharacterized coiled-coil protein SlyX